MGEKVSGISCLEVPISRESNVTSLRYLPVVQVLLLGRLLSLGLLLALRWRDGRSVMMSYSLTFLITSSECWSLATSVISDEVRLLSSKGAAISQRGCCPTTPYIKWASLRISHTSNTTQTNQLYLKLENNMDVALFLFLKNKKLCNENSVQY